MEQLGVLQNRVVIVIGAGSSGEGWGNGKASAVCFARAGASVLAVDVNRAAAAATAALIKAEDGVAESAQADVTSSEDMKRITDLALHIYGRIDVLHYNVGIAVTGDCVELEEEQWSRAFAVNVTGCFLACKHILPVMVSQQRGVVLTTGSIAAMRWSGASYVSYYASKAALMQFTRAIAVQYASSGLRAVSLVPGLMDTPMIYTAPVQQCYGYDDREKLAAHRNAQCPTGRMGDAWDVAHAAVFLASDAAKYITATELVIDGGITAKFS
jgi:NAD(P)-dependent dehydrogenase (short-subunit alcohol dehydrogenase family)